MTTAQLTAADLLEQTVTLLAECETLTDERKAAFLEALAQGRFTREMAREVAAAFRAQARQLDMELDAEHAAAASVQSQQAEAALEREELGESCAKEHFGAMEQTAMEFAAECATEERRVDGAVEGVARSGEQGEMDALRTFLAKKQ